MGILAKYLSWEKTKSKKAVKVKRLIDMFVNYLNRKFKT